MGRKVLKLRPNCESGTALAQLAVQGSGDRAPRPIFPNGSIAPDAVKGSLDHFRGADFFRLDPRPRAILLHRGAILATAPRRSGMRVDPAKASRPAPCAR